MSDHVFTKNTRDAALDGLLELVPAFAEKVRPFYADLGWVWGSDRYSPTTDMIETSLREKIKDLRMRKDVVATDGGGLRVEISDKDPTAGWVGRLKFHYEASAYGAKSDPENP